MTTWRVMVAVTALVCAAACARERSGIIGTVSELSTRIEVGVDGGADVHEDITLTPSADGVVQITRQIETRKADAIALASLSVDGVPVESGSNGLSVANDGPRHLSVIWQSSSRQKPVRLSLTYRVTAAVAAREPRGRLEWTILEPGRGFAVASADVTLVLPDSARTYDGTGMAEVGWTVELVPRGVVARRDSVADHEAATLLAVFDIDHARITPPEWEWNADRQAQYFLALLAAGAFILVIGVGTLIQLRVQYPPAKPGTDAAGRAAALSDRQMLARGLRLAGWSGLGFSALCALLAHRTLEGLEPAVQFIPGSMAIVFVMFLVASGWYGMTVRRLSRHHGST